MLKNIVLKKQIIQSLFLTVFFFAVLLLIPSKVYADQTWDGGAGADTNWNNCVNWTNNTCPTVTDIAIFNGTSSNNSTINVAIDVKGISIASGYGGIITQNTGITVAVEASGFNQATGTFVGGNSTIDDNGDFIISGGTFTSTSGSLTITGSFTKSNSPTFNHNNGTVTFDGTNTASTSITASGVTFNLVTVNRSENGSATTLTIASGTTIPLGNSPTVTLYNSFGNSNSYNLTNNGTITVGTGVATFNIDGNLTNSVTTGVITGTNTSLIVNGNLVNNGSITMNSCNTFNFNNYKNTGYGSLTNNSGATFNMLANPTFNINGSFIVSSGSINFPTTNVTLILDDGGTSASTSIDSPSITFVNPVTITRNEYATNTTLTIASGTTIPLGNSPTVSLINTWTGGSGSFNFINSGTITIGTGIATFNVDGTFTNSITTGVITGTNTSLIVNGNFTNNGSITMNSCNTFDINAYRNSGGAGSLTNSSGATFNMLANPTFNINGSFIVSSGSINFPTTNVTLILDDGGFTGSTSIDSPSITFVTPVRITRNEYATNTNLTIASGTTIPLGNSPTVTLINTWTGGSGSFNLINNGTITIGTGIATFSVDGTFTNSVTTGVITGTNTSFVMNGNFTNNGSITMNSCNTFDFNTYRSSGGAGSLTNNSGATFNMSANPTFNINGSFIVSSGSINFPTTNVTLNLDDGGFNGSTSVNAPNITFVAPVTIYRNEYAQTTNLTIALGTTIPLGNSPTVTLINTYTGNLGSYNLINNGTITIGTGVATFNVDGTFTNSVTTGVITGTNTSFVMNGNFTNNGSITMNSCNTFDFNTYRSSGGAGSLTNNSGATFNMSANPTFNINGSFIVSSGSINFPTTNVTLNLDDGGFNGSTSVNAPSITFVTPVTITRNENAQTISLTITSGTTIPLGNSPTVTLINTYTSGAGSYNLINNGTITIGTGVATFNVDGTFTNSVTTGVITGTNTSLVVNGNLTNNGSITMNSCNTLDINAYRFSGGNGNFINSSGATFAISANPTISANGSFTVNAGTISFPTSGISLTLDGTTGTQTLTTPTITSYTSFSKTAASTLSIIAGITTGNFTFSGGTFPNPGSLYFLKISGNFIQSSASSLGGTNLPISFEGSSNQTISKSAGTFISTIVVNKSGGVLSLVTSFDTTGTTCTVTSGILSLAGNDFICGSTFTIQANGTLRIWGQELFLINPVLDLGSTVEYVGNGDGLANNYLIKNWSYSNFKVNFTDSLDTLTGDIPAYAINESFESSSFPPLGWSTGGNQNWTRTGTQYQNGSYSAMSGNSGFNINSYLKRSAQVFSNTTLSFYWKVSSESNYDWLLFCLDNDSCTKSSGYNTRISGEVGWVQVNIPLTAGYHSLYWSYQTDGSVANGLNAGWIDNIVLTNTDTPVTSLTVNGNFTIANGIFNSPATLNITGDLISSGGTFTNNSGIVNMNATTSGHVITGNFTGSSSLYNLTFNGSGGAWSMGSSTISVANNFNLTLGTLTSTSGILSIGGNFTKAGGTFTHNSGTISFADNTKTSTLTYDVPITFFNFSITTPSKQIYFDNVHQTNVAGTLTINGQVCSTMVKLYSLSSGNQFSINATGAVVINFAEIKDSNAIVALSANDSIGISNNTNWTIDGGTCYINISGTCKFFDETTNCGDTGTVRVAVDSVLKTQTQPTVAGTWTIYNVVKPATNAVITVYIEGAVNSDKAASVTKYDGTGYITGIKLFKEHLTLGSDDNATISNSEIGTYDNSVSGSSDVFFDNNGTTLTVDNTGFSTQARLYILPSNIFTPAGIVNTTDLANYGTINGGSNTFNVSGSWNNQATFNANTSTVNMTSTVSGKTLSGTMVTTSAFNNLTFNGVGGTWTFSGNASDILGNLSISNGTVTAPSTTLTISGNYSNLGTFTNNGGTVVFNSTSIGKTLTGTLNGTSSFNNLTFNGVGGSWTLSNIPTTVSSNLTITAGTLTAPSTTLTIGGNYSNSGTFTNNSGTVTFNSTSGGKTLTGTLNGTSSFNNLTFNGSGGAWTLSNIPTTIANDLNITAGTLTSTSTTLTIGGSYSNSGTYSNNSGTVLFNSTSGGKTLSGTMTGSSSFSILTFNGVGGSWSMGVNSATVTNDLNILNGTLTAPSTTLTIGGNYSNSGTFTNNSGTVTFNSTSIGKTLTGSLNGTSGFNNLTFNGSGGAWTLSNIPTTVNSNLTITAGTLTAPSTTLTIGGSYSNSGTFANNAGSILMNSTSAGKTLSGTMTGGSSFNNITFDGVNGAWSFGSSSLTVNNFTITNGSVTAPSNNLTIAKNFSNLGTYSHNNGNVVLNGTGQSITGNTTFFNLSKTVTSPDTLTYEGHVTNTITVSGTWTMKGTNGNLLTLYSSSSPTQWRINPTGARDIAYLSVKDSNNINATGITVVGYNITDEGNNINWKFNHIPILNSITNIAEATDASGQVSFNLSVSDLDLNETKLKLEYSLNNGTNWYSTYILSATPNAGSIDLNNANVFQIGTANGIDTSLGPISIAVIWDTRSAQNGSGSLSSTDISNAKIRITPNDFIQDGLAFISDPFTLDNVSPTGLSALNSNSVISGAYKNITLTWTSVSETNFNHYEIWYGTNQSDVDNRSGSAIKWDQSNDSNLSNINTVTTQINGFNEHTYYFKIWAVDNYGNIETVNSSSVYINTKPNDPSNLGPSSLTDSSWTSDNTPTLSFDLSDPDGGNIKYTIQIDNNSNFSSPELAYTSSFSLNTSRIFTSPELADGSYYFRVKAIDTFNIESNWTIANSGGVAFKIDTTAPSTPGIPSTSTPTASSTPNWTWTVSTDTGGVGLDIAPYIVEWCNDISFTNCQTKTATSITNSYLHTAGLTSGTWYLRVKAKDLLGNESQYSPIGNVVISTEAPIGTITINTGELYTNKNSVTLTIAGSDNFDNPSSLQMMLSNKPDFLGGVYEPYNTISSWNLENIEGIETVYMKLKNTLGTVSSIFSDTIIFDKTSPSGLDIISPVDITIKVNRPEYKWHVGVDNISGILKYNLKVSNQDNSFFVLDNLEGFSDGLVNSYDRSKYTIKKEGEYIILQTKDSALWGDTENNGLTKDGLVTINLQVYDKTGNLSETQKTFTYDQTPPALEVNSIDSFSNLNIRPDSSEKTYTLTNQKPLFKGNISSGEQSSITLLATNTSKPSVTCIVNSNTLWECKFATSLSYGIWKVNVSATDNVGNITVLPAITLNIVEEKVETVVVYSPEPVTTPSDTDTNPPVNQPLEDGYTLNLTIVDGNQNPVVGAIVTIPNDDTVYITDKNGKVKVKILEGEYKVNVSYKGKNGEQIVLVKGISDVVQNAIGRTIERTIEIKLDDNTTTTQKVTVLIKTAVENPITSIGAVSALSVSALSILVAYPSSISSFSNFFFGFLWFYKRKRKKRYGVIFDSETNKAVPFALIRALNKDTGVIVKDTVSDINGRYSLLVDPGKYILQINQQPYVLFEKQYDASKEGFEQITENIGLEISKGEHTNRINIRKIFINFSNFVFYLGFVLTSLMLIVNFQIVSAIFMLLYLIQIFILIKRREPRGWGIVSDLDSKAPISGVFISIIDPIEERQLNVQITDKKGRFGFIPGKESQLLKITASGYEFTKINQNLLTRKLSSGELAFEIEPDKVNDLQVSMKKIDSGLVQNRAFT
ncbi:MAG: hypothetical protein WCO33_01400 [bacterium]